MKKIVTIVALMLSACSSAWASDCESPETINHIRETIGCKYLLDCNNLEVNFVDELPSLTRKNVEIAWNKAGFQYQQFPDAQKKTVAYLQDIVAKNWIDAGKDVPHSFKLVGAHATDYNAQIKRYECQITFIPNRNKMDNIAKAYTLALALQDQNFQLTLMVASEKTGEQEKFVNMIVNTMFMTIGPKMLNGLSKKQEFTYSVQTTRNGLHVDTSKLEETYSETIVDALE